MPPYSRLVILSFYLFLNFSSPAMAFKINTHAFVGNEVVQSIKSCTEATQSPCFYLDLKDRKKMIVPIKKKLKQAILKYPQSYIIGNFGPDAFPDMLAGQTIIHPGINDGDPKSYGTGDWINLLLDGVHEFKPTTNSDELKNLAFAHGFAAHAAADTFAHTYVNQYAGGIFSFSDHETEVDERHNLLESLIGKYTPEIRGDTYTYLNSNINSALPLDFIYQYLYSDRGTKKQYNKTVTAEHILLMHNIYEELDRALFRKELPKTKFDLKRMMKMFSGIDASQSQFNIKDFVDKNIGQLEGAGLVQIIEIFAAKYIASQYFGIQLENDEAQKVADLASEIHDKLNNNSLGVVKKLHQFEDNVDKFKRKVTKSGLKKIKKLKEKLKVFYDISKNLESQKQEIKKTKSEIERVQDEIVENGYGICMRPCRDIPKKTNQQSKCEKLGIFSSLIVDCIIKVDNPVYLACTTPCEGMKVGYVNLRNEQKKLETTVHNLESDIKSIKSNLMDMKIDDDVLRVSNNIQAYQKKLKNKINKGSEALSENLNAWTLSFRKLVTRQRDDVKTAIHEYIIANTQAMTNSTYTAWWKEGTIKDANASILEPYKVWFLCYGPVVVGGVPSKTALDLCENTLFNISDIMDKLDELENKILKAHSIGKFKPLSLKEYIKENGPYEAMNLAQPVFDKLQGTLNLNNPLDAKRFHNGFSFSGKDKQVDSHFANPENHSLLAFVPGDPVSNRVKNDMMLGDARYFSAEKFPPVFNAIQLAKLSLLDAKQLNNLAHRLGVNKNTTLYLEDYHSNILTHWLRSIDGNHQWLKLSPPNLLNYGFSDKAYLNSYDFILGRSTDYKKHTERIYSFIKPWRKKPGMLYYSNLEARTKVFNQLFKGPLSPALYNLDGNFRNIIDYRYIYQPSYDDPYPSILEE